VVVFETLYSIYILTEFISILHIMHTHTHGVKVTMWVNSTRTWHTHIGGQSHYAGNIHIGHCGCHQLRKALLIWQNQSELHEQKIVISFIWVNILAP